jgi:acyl-CoA synthetase (NDP forming)
MYSNLNELFNPVGVAVYGASSDSAKLGGRPVRFLLDQKYDGGIYPINPRYTELDGLPCFPDAVSVGKRIDTAIILVPAAKVFDAIRDCAAAKVKYALVLTSGFGEMGAEGKRQQKEIADFALSAGMRVLGPNCLGVCNFAEKIPMTFMNALENNDIAVSDVAFVSQSGAFGSHLFAVAREMGIGYDYWVTTGNEADLGLNEFLEYFAGRDDVRCIACYMEDARNGEKFVRALDACQEHDKPAVILKVGRSESGSRAASSHTGALAGNAKVYSSVFSQKNVVQAEDVYELLDFSSFCKTQKSLGNGRVAIVTVSGGAGVLHADKLDEYGLKLATLSQETQTALKDVLVPFASTHNPVDITGQGLTIKGCVRSAITHCLSDANVDVVIMYLSAYHSSGERIAGEIIDAAKTSGKLVVVSWMAAPPNWVKHLEHNGIPVFPEPVRGIRSIAALFHYREGQRLYHERIHTPASSYDSGKANDIRDWLMARRKQGQTLSEFESRKVLQAFGIPVTEADLAATREQAAQIADRIGYPVVLKVDSPFIPHKSDVGGVLLGLTSREQVLAGYDAILARVRKKVSPDVPISGVLVTRMEKNTVEILIGSKTDPVFGPTVAFGMGGIFVEVFKELSLRLAPIDLNEARRMTEEVRASSVLDGVRGQPARDKAAVHETLVSLSGMVTALRDIVAEVDINPLMVFEKGGGAKAADALIILK